MSAVRRERCTEKVAEWISTKLGGHILWANSPRLFFVSSYDMVKRITTIEGLAVGHSSGAAVVGALHIAEKLKEGTIVVVFPDGGDRYLSHEI